MEGRFLRNSWEYLGNLHDLGGKKLVAPESQQGLCYIRRGGGGVIAYPGSTGRLVEGRFLRNSWEYLGDLHDLGGKKLVEPESQQGLCYIRRGGGGVIAYPGSTGRLVEGRFLRNSWEYLGDLHDLGGKKLVEPESQQGLCYIRRGGGGVIAYPGSTGRLVEGRFLRNSWEYLGDLHDLGGKKLVEPESQKRTTQGKSGEIWPSIFSTTKRYYQIQVL